MRMRSGRRRTEEDDDGDDEEDGGEKEQDVDEGPVSLDVCLILPPLLQARQRSGPIWVRKGPA
eukprot:4161426-Pyramimonas_sp.AAC.1